MYIYLGETDLRTVGIGCTRGWGWLLFCRVAHRIRGTTTQSTELFRMTDLILFAMLYSFHVTILCGLFHAC